MILGLHGWNQNAAGGKGYVLSHYGIEGNWPILNWIPSDTKFDPVFNLPEDTIVKLILGVVVIFLLFFLRGKFKWFLLSPIGFFLGASLPAYWTPVLISLVAKYLIIRVGGVELYESKGKPIALGLIVGWGVCWLLCEVVSFGNVWMKAS